MPSLDDLVILNTWRSRKLAERIYKSFLECSGESNGGKYTGYAGIKTFPVGEVCPKIMKSVREKHVYVIHTFDTEDDSVDPNLPLLELYFINSALRRSSAAKITNVIPYIPYLRQDRGDRPRVPITARAVADLIESKCDRVVTFAMHSPQEEGFFDIPVDNLSATSLFLDDFVDKPDFAAAATDGGAVKRTKRFAERTGMKYAICEKTKDGKGKLKIPYIIGKSVIRGKNIVFREDIVDTGKTVEEDAQKLREKGALDIYVCAEHLLLSEKDGIRAEDRMRRSGIKVITTDTVPRSEEFLEANKDWLIGIKSVAPKIGEAIFKIQTGQSLTESDMFETEYSNEFDSEYK